MSPFSVDAEQWEWVRRASSRRGDVPLDRDDLMSAALESLWVAWQRRPDHVLAYAIVTFLRRRADLCRRSHVHRKVFHVQAPVEHIHLLQDEVSRDPVLIVMAKEQEGRPSEGPPCHLCGTRYGRGRQKSPWVPKRIRGLCYACDQRRRRLDRVGRVDLV